MRISAKASVSSLRRVAAAGLLATGLIAAFTGGAAAEAGPRPGDRVPSELRPPAGNVSAGTFDARGVQIYECSGGEWKFVEPVATLFGANGRPEAIHFRGPSWQSLRDGSLVEAKAIANVPVRGTIPLLLLEATKTRGDGLFGRVTFIQRLSTSGGAAPTEGCDEGEVRGVPYRAQYRLFVKNAR